MHPAAAPSVRGRNYERQHLTCASSPAGSNFRCEFTPGQALLSGFDPNRGTPFNFGVTVRVDYWWAPVVPNGAAEAVFRGRQSKY
jgi:hypothetical protein